jgi:hypothetical protein
MSESIFLCLIGRSTDYLWLIGAGHVTVSHLWFIYAHNEHYMSKSNILFYWSIYSLFGLNNTWKRDSFQVMIFVYVCSTWGIVELKTRFEAWITRNYLKCVSLFHLSYLITIMAYLCFQKTPIAQIKFFMYHMIRRSADYLC